MLFEVRRLGVACSARNEAEATRARNIVINAMLGYRIIMLPSAREVPEGAPAEPVKCLGRDDASCELPRPAIEPC